MRTTQFDKHEFIEALMLILHEFLLRNKPNAIRSSPTEKEKRAMNILFSANNIIECIDQINFTIEMLSGFRKRDKGLMNRHDYVIFMIENFYLRITSILDRALRFTNLVFEIGLQDRECRVSEIIKDHQIRGTQLKILIEKLNKFTEEYRNERNQVAHSERFKDDLLTDIEGFYILQDIDESKEFNGFNNFFKNRADRYIAEKKIEFKEIAMKIENLIHEFFDVISPFVKSNLDKYI